MFLNMLPALSTSARIGCEHPQSDFYCSFFNLLIINIFLHFRQGNPMPVIHIGTILCIQFIICP